MASKAIYVRDLPERGADGPWGVAGQVKLYCPSCGESWSANRGDYVNRNPDAPFRCTHCQGRPLCRLGVLRARWEPWRKPEPPTLTHPISGLRHAVTPGHVETHTEARARANGGTGAGTSTVPSTSTGGSR